MFLFGACPSVCSVFEVHGFMGARVGREPHFELRFCRLFFPSRLFFRGWRHSLFRRILWLRAWWLTSVSLSAVDRVRTRCWRLSRRSPTSAGSSICQRRAAAPRCWWVWFVVCAESSNTGRIAYAQEVHGVWRSRGVAVVCKTDEAGRSWRTQRVCPVQG